MLCVLCLEKRESGDPPGYNCNLQEACMKQQKGPRSLWEFLGTMKITPGRQVKCLQLRFAGALWAVWVGTSWGGAPVCDH